jgi:hypothetical protein
MKEKLNKTVRKPPNPTKKGEFGQKVSKRCGKYFKKGGGDLYFSGDTSKQTRVCDEKDPNFVHREFSFRSVSSITSRTF